MPEQLKINVYESTEKTVEVEFPFHRRTRDGSGIEKVFNSNLFVALTCDQAYSSIELYERPFDCCSDEEDAILGKGEFTCSPDDFTARLIHIRRALDDLLDNRIPEMKKV